MGGFSKERLIAGIIAGLVVVAIEPLFSYGLNKIGLSKAA